MRWPLSTLLALSALGCGSEPLSEVDPALFEATPSYAVHIRPIYAEHCHLCHAEHGVKAGGVELDRYRTALSTRVKSACTAISPDLVERYGDALRRFSSDDDDPCEDWEVNSMPPNAQPRLTRAEQVILVRWVVTGGQP